MAGWAGGGVGCLGGPGSFLVLDSFFGDFSTHSEMSVHEPASSSRTPQIPRAKQKRKNASTDVKAVEKKKKEGKKKARRTEEGQEEEESVSQVTGTQSTSKSKVLLAGATHFCNTAAKAL